MEATKTILAALVGIVFATNGASTQELKEKTVKGQIFGVWSVVSVVNDADGKKTEPYGAHPKGQFIFTADGYFSTNIVRPDRPKFVSNNRGTGTPEENKAVVQGSNSSFGTYEINSDGSVTLHIVGSTFPNWDGTKQKRLAAIKGDEITWTNPTASMGGNTVITLQRAKFGDRYPQRDEK
jgi:Lipocalin-like domain